MTGLSTDDVLNCAVQAQTMYHRLVLVVVPPTITRVDVTHQVSKKLGCETLNVNLEVSAQLVELTQRLRKLRFAELFEDIVDRFSVTHELCGRIAVLENIEILFEPSLECHALNLLEKASRNRVLVVTWRGWIAENVLTYAEPGYPEFQRYSVTNLLVKPLN